jgi:hypothetical protein
MGLDWTLAPAGHDGYLTLPAGAAPKVARCPLRPPAMVKRLAWQTCIGLGLLLIGLLVGTLIESRKENEHLSSVIRSLPYSLQAPALHGGGVGITSCGGQLVLSCGDQPDPWISTDHKHAVISLRKAVAADRLLWAQSRLVRVIQILTKLKVWYDYPPGPSSRQLPVYRA